MGLPSSQLIELYAIISTIVKVKCYIFNCITKE